MTDDKQHISPPDAGAIMPADDGAIGLAGAILRDGGLVGMPTETVYGLAADSTNAEAVARIYEAKGRPRFNPLISHVVDLGQALDHGVLDKAALKLAQAFWPGPLTLVVPLRAGSAISHLARAGLDTVALRVPGHPAARAIIAAAGRPLAAPSANRSGRVSPTSARDVAEELGAKVDLIIDGGACDIGVESSVVACVDGEALLLRPGGAAREDLSRALGRDIGMGETTADSPRAPGLLASHYAPLASVHTNVTNAPRNHAVLTFAGRKIVQDGHSGQVLDLSETGDLREAAARLFSALRELDATGPSAISVAPIPSEGLGEAINDRLSRASAPRNILRPD
jgi:L-threonylcarbamoyladenylate synthase